MKRISFLGAMFGVILLGVAACAPPQSVLAYNLGKDLDSTMADTATYVKRPTCAPAVTVPCATPENRHTLRVAAERAVKDYDAVQAAIGASSFDAKRTSAAASLDALRKSLQQAEGK